MEKSPVGVKGKEKSLLCVEWKDEWGDGEPSGGSGERVGTRFGPPPHQVLGIFSFG